MLRIEEEHKPNVIYLDVNLDTLLKEGVRASRRKLDLWT